MEEKEKQKIISLHRNDYGLIISTKGGQYIDRFVSKLGLIPRAAFVTDTVSDISVIYRYIVDIGRYFFIFPSFNFRLLISCREGPTPEMSTIYRDISVPASTLDHKYFVSFIDDCTRVSWVYLLKSKHDVLHVSLNFQRQS